MKLSQATRAMGWQLVVTPRPQSHPDRTGSNPRSSARALTDGRIAVKADKWVHAYDVSHEIAEAHHGHKHTEMLWMTQVNILAAWHTMRSGVRNKHVRVMCRGFRPAKGAK